MLIPTLPNEMCSFLDLNLNLTGYRQWQSGAENITERLASQRMQLRELGQQEEGSNATNGQQRRKKVGQFLLVSLSFFFAQMDLETNHLTSQDVHFNGHGFETVRRFFSKNGRSVLKPFQYSCAQIHRDATLGVTYISCCNQLGTKEQTQPFQMK